ncbi:MAG: 4-(cytidine 5'-diphospho)-2-C-methyl-D-erythritol kinase [Spirochaetaceae bacterium]|jgi:4-diphosphocytidyl-2-C-methyl-D-erythritol kinase|nr:4-(cytidine 5'-diphospho)-2-C-methyl-D-erythritol kinase [Spirochaetaceae bacterium]
MPSVLTIEAPCKINLHLRVLGRREDGFHDLESLFLALSWGDTLTFEVKAGEGDCEVLMDRELPPGGNLVEKAVWAFREATGFRRSLRIRLVKRLPLGAGLGGGSSDAAAVLKALAILGGIALDKGELNKLALGLGSDVPFFLGTGAAFVSGRGGFLEPVDPPEGIWIVLVKPGFSSSTPGAFALLDRVRAGSAEAGSGRAEAGSGRAEAGNGRAEAGPSREDLVRALGEGPETWPYTNDFLPLFIEHGPPEEGAVYSRLIGDFKRLGAAFAGLSGSGSTCFGVFKEKEAAKRAEKALRSPWNLVKTTFPLRIEKSGIKI